MASASSGRPTLEAVASVAGVSRATVSRVINGVPTVDPAIVDVVRRAIEDTGYVPNLAARSLVTRRTGSVALVVSEPPGHRSPLPFLERIFTDPYLGRVTAGAQEALRPRDVHLAIMPADPPAHDQVVRYVRQGHVDGVLLITSSADDPLPARLVGLGVPVVLSARITGGAMPGGVPAVDLDQAAGGRLAAEHLLATGRRRLAVVTGPTDAPFMRARLDAFVAAVTAAGLGRPAVADADFTRPGGEAAARRLLAGFPGVDGIFAGNDLMADGVSTALQSAGRRVPDDVAVVGFDDSSAAAQAHPPLTTVRQPVEDMARRMAELLLEGMGVREPGTDPGADAPDDAARPGRVVTFAPELVIRSSA
ncbi:LacI family DNA-binding transcriptional regulator [Myceligenerans pegani]|uniref:LacI family DNA-binding transcriptional regulator n=1 Tax=Myceligenerans pegani TaxID=2776917 RepID=A0ABR9MZC0_9MICO|nr:LacI family DNA-binding transcriptional regulator [Myceligenerans sp. TRM 65318]MBE1876750.1 LacI family DNA-binding transcriptional regulator [Myceligenerans sp. TRM 65318]MBE3019021.1 LacI family DNA-binding transcriptional regulator [Myceligenerans sp. TRM 65318]